MLGIVPMWFNFNMKGVKVEVLFSRHHDRIVSNQKYALIEPEKTWLLTNSHSLRIFCVGLRIVNPCFTTMAAVLS